MGDKTLFAVLCVVIIGAMLFAQHLAGVEPVTGVASWYGEEACRVSPDPRCPTASGESFDPDALTCASWYHDFGTHLRIENINNGRDVICRVNDRGPAKRLERLVDLSRAAFAEIAELDQGLITVKVSVVAE